MNSRIANRRQFGLAFGLSLLAPSLARSDQEPGPIDALSELDWQQQAARGEIFEHWTPEEDATWSWYRLERFTAGQWETVGISLPVNKLSGEPYQPADGYLGTDRIPEYVRQGELPSVSWVRRRRMAPSQFFRGTGGARVPDPEIQARDGRPPSQWLRSLYAQELRRWLPLVEAPQATVSGMTFWVHLVRDHSFDPRRIEGLTEHEFLLLHSAAHHGY